MIDNKTGIYPSSLITLPIKILLNKGRLLVVDSINLLERSFHQQRQDFHIYLLGSLYCGLGRLTFANFFRNVVSSDQLPKL